MVKVTSMHAHLKIILTVNHVIMEMKKVAPQRDVVGLHTFIHILFLSVSIQKNYIFRLENKISDIRSIFLISYSTKQFIKRSFAIAIVLFECCCNQGWFKIRKHLFEFIHSFESYSCGV